ncbi:MAG: hypothetical protein ACI9P8_002018 [Bacteroidia bacterium]|jgi:uncharacterized protein with HEPN domain
MSSDRHKKKLLTDIIQAIDEIELFLEGKRDFNLYENNLMLKKAIERELEIIGEAMNRLLQLQPNIEISDARKVVNLRNRIIHGYDKVVDEVVWGILIRHIPQLKIEVAQQLSQ